MKMPPVNASPTFGHLLGLRPSIYADTLTSGSEMDQLSGGLGDDELIAGFGDDRLFGGVNTTVTLAGGTEIILKGVDVSLIGVDDFDFI